MSQHTRPPPTAAQLPAIRTDVIGNFFDVRGAASGSRRQWHRNVLWGGERCQLVRGKVARQGSGGEVQVCERAVGHTPTELVQRTCGRFHGGPQVDLRGGGSEGELGAN